MTRRISRREAVGAIAAAVGAGTVVVATARTTEQQPHMTTALDLLRKAQAELAAATADKGGHRVAAERLVREAIGEVEKGISFDNHHP